MATEYAGYMGKILLVDLTAETAEEYPWTDARRKQTLGGKAAALEILRCNLTGKAVPFSEENWIIFSTGPLTGTGAPGSERFEITALSPETGLVASSNCGGKFGVFLKKAGLDALILRGRCKSPCWLEISEQGVFFHDAAFLWGLNTLQCRSQLETALSGKDFQSLCIGPAGEDLLPCATVVGHGRTVGRKGFGAVLGWKGVKAITVSGTKSIPLDNPQAAEAFIRQWNRAVAENPITSDPSKFSSCPGCPIRCKKKAAMPQTWADRLGLDGLEAGSCPSWLSAHGIEPAQPAKNASHGKRREELYQSLLSRQQIPAGENSFQTYQNLTEALSAMGLCLFTAGSCMLPAARGSVCGGTVDPGAFLFACTGISLTAEQLLHIGSLSREMYRAFRR